MPKPQDTPSEHAAKEETCSELTGLQVFPVLPRVLQLRLHLGWTIHPVHSAGLTRSASQVLCLGLQKLYCFVTIHEEVRWSLNCSLDAAHSQPFSSTEAERIYSSKEHTPILLEEMQHRLEDESKGGVVPSNSMDFGLSRAPFESFKARKRRVHGTYAYIYIYMYI